MQLNCARHVLKQRKSVKKKKEIQQNLLELQNIQSAVLLQQRILSYLRHNLHIRNFFLHTKMCNYQLSHWSQPLEAGNYRLPLLAEKKSMSYIQTKREKHSGCVFLQRSSCISAVLHAPSQTQGSTQAGRGEWMWERACVLVNASVRYTFGKH